MDRAAVAPQKAHRASRNKASQKKTKKGKSGSGGAKPKQAVNAPGSLARRLRLAADRAEKRAPNPAAPIDRSGGDAAGAAPRVVAVVGPAGTGKTTIVRNLVRHYSKRNIKEVTGPVTIVTGRKRRVTFLEVGPDLPSMIDAAKVADLVLLTIDASYGFEMETFEFLNIAAAHGMPKVIGVLTHIDGLKDGKQSRKAKKSFKDRFWAELYDGAKLFYFSGLTTTGDYLKREVLNLARFISVSKFPVIRWRNEHPYVLADRVEDISGPSVSNTANRSIVAFGYVRGTPLRISDGGWHVHVAGVGDLVAHSVKIMPDPCPAPDADAVNAASDAGSGEAAKGGQDASEKSKIRRRVGERERLVYAPMAPEVSGISYDRDAVYIDIAKEDIRFSDVKDRSAGAPDADDDGDANWAEMHSDDDSSDGEGETMVKSLQRTGIGIDERMKDAELQLVSGGRRFVSEQFEDGRRRRRVVFGGDDADKIGDGHDSDSAADSDEDDDSAAEKATDDSPSDDDEEDDVFTDDAGKQAQNGTHDEEDQHHSGSDSEVLGSDSSGAEPRPNLLSDDAAASEGDLGNPETETAMRWKINMLDHAAKRMRSQFSSSKSLAKFIYSSDDPVAGSQASVQTDAAFNDDDDFFRVKNRAGSSLPLSDAATISAAISVKLQDVTRLLPDTVHDWINDMAACTRLRKRRFGTGQGASDAGNGSDSDGAIDDPGMPVDGDFEDLETGERHTGSAALRPRNKHGDDRSEDDDLETIRQKKLQKKAMFDAEWDEEKGNRSGGRHGRTGEGSEGIDGETMPDDDLESGSGEEEVRKGRGDPATRPKSRQAQRSSAARMPDERQVERARLAALRSQEFGDLDRDSRAALEGILPGCYIRMEMSDVPVEFVKYFDPKKPVVIGGLKHADDSGMSFVRARVRRHRFKRGVLKSSDPVVFSIGWRRIQSVPIYDVEDQGGRRRFLKYTPEYLHCNATFWAPRVSPGSGVIMCQSLGRSRAGFRIAGSGVVTEVDASFKIVKKLKLVGEPYKVHHNTAFIKGMFNSELEVSRYIGAGIRTVSGIRGSIKKPVSERAAKDGKHKERAMGQSPAGAFRAGFEDKVLLSDIVFLRAWVPVEPPRYCTVASNLLDGDRGGSEEGTWRMRTVRELRQERGLPIPRHADSLYGEVERKTPLFAPLRIPKNVESALPFASKPKNFAAAPKLKASTKSERKRVLAAERAVVMEPGERREAAIVHALYNIRKDRLGKRREASAKRLAAHKAAAAREDAKHAASTSERKKRKYAIEGAAAARKSKRARGAADEED